MNRTSSVILGGLLLLATNVFAGNEHYKTISGPKWTKIERYVFTSAKYVVACPSDRKCEVGMGVFMFKKPLGQRVKFSGEQEITVFGAGSLHVRVIDGKGPCKIGFALKDQTPVKFPEITFP